MTHLVCIGDIYFIIWATTHVSFLGWNFGHAKGAPNSTHGVAHKAKGKGRSILVNVDASTFARVLPVPNGRMPDELYANFGRFPNVLHTQDNAGVRIP